MDYYDKSLDEEPPKCHFAEMHVESADDVSECVTFWECKHCGHTKEISRVLI